MTCTGGSGGGSANGPCPAWTYDATTNRINTSGFTYDAAGDGTHTYDWHAEGRLKSMDSGNTATYTYNALGWRVEKKIGSTYTEVLYDQSGESLGENNRTSWTQSYVNFGGRHLAIYQNNATYFPHVNALGSTVMVSDYTGAIVEDKLFYPWGQDWQAAGTLYEERFAKLQHRDSETSLDPTPNRMFSSTQGRWLSPDAKRGRASNPQSLNRYAYVKNNACSATDPTGLDDEGPTSTVCVVNGSVYSGFACEVFYNSFFGSGTGPVNPDLWDIHHNKQSKWDKAEAKLSDANDLLQKLKPSGDCSKDLGAISAATGLTPILTLIQFQANLSNWNDATASAQLAQYLYPQSNPDYGTLAKMGITIRQYVSGSVVAAAAEPGSMLADNIYFSPSYVNSKSVGYNAALLMHEVMHNLGPEDPALLTALGFKGDDPSQYITDKLARDCFGVTQ